MTKEIYLQTLIDKAAKRAGNDSKLAVMLHTRRQTVSHWRNGHKPCPVADQVLMAHIAGLNAWAYAATGLIAQHAGTAKAAALAAALKQLPLFEPTQLSAYATQLVNYPTDPVYAVLPKNAGVIDSGEQPMLAHEWNAKLWRQALQMQNNRRLWFSNNLRRLLVPPGDQLLERRHMDNVSPGR